MKISKPIQVAGVALLVSLAYAAGVGSNIPTKQDTALQAAPLQQVQQPTLTEAQRADAVYYVCEWSRQSVDGPSEEFCGDLQDAFQMEYLCKERNALPTNQCWVEGPSGEAQESAYL